MIIITSNEEVVGENYYYRAKLKDIYTTEEDIAKGQAVSIDDTEYTLIGEMVSDPVTDVADTVIDVGEKVWNFVENFKHNPIGTIITALLDLLTMLFDAVQIVINSIQTVSLGTFTDLRLAYEYNELVKDANSDGKRDMYTKVSKYNGEDYVSYEGQKYVYVDGDDKGFSMDTEIPVIPIDVYNLSISDISLLDINFLTVDKENRENSLWMTLRNIAVTIMHVTMYLAAAVLITSLILHGIYIVKGSLDNPQAQMEHKKGIKRFFISLLMLVGSVVIMALSIYASNMFLEGFQSDTDELPIRVNVSLTPEENSQSDSESTTSGGYSFSTNFTGYIRYMAQINDVDKYTEKAVYTFEYIALVLVNVAGGVFMVVRMIVMLLLAIIGPIVATFYAIKKEDNGTLNYRTWAELYVTLAAVQILMAIASKIVLECTIFN